MTLRDIIIISDLDGTIVPRGGRVSKENTEALYRLEAQGAAFAIATGRTPEAARGYVADLPITGPSVFFNGAMLYDWRAGSVIKICPLSSGEEKDLWPRFAAYCKDTLQEACIEVYTEETCHIITEKAHDDPRLSKEFYRFTHGTLKELSDLGETPWLKFFVCGTPENLRQVEQAAVKFGLTAYANGFYSEANYYEFVAKGVSKGSMLQAIRQLPAYQGKKIIALGDYMNDEEMLKAADIAIVPENAHEALKETADFVGCSVEENLIVWIEKHQEEILAKL